MLSQAAVSRVATDTMEVAVDLFNAQAAGEEPDPFPCSVAREQIAQVKPADLSRQRRNGWSGQISIRSEVFRRKWFPEAALEDWNDWRWQLKNRLTTARQLDRIITLSPEEREALCGQTQTLPVAITPYYASLLDENDPEQAIRRTVIPVLKECEQSPGESADPLEEGSQCPVENLVHRYPDRVLFLVTASCSTYCRYCTRSRIVGRKHACSRPSMELWKEAIDYIRGHKEVRDVLISGGDPLTLPDESIDWLLGQLRGIRHVEIIRIGTKIPVVLPHRITFSLVKILKKYHPLFMSIHFTHPAEVTPEVRKACERLADAGIPMGSQTVLLSGINDSVNVMKRLYHKLLMARVRPYYLYQCDPISGSSHFRTPVEKGIDIIKGLRGHTSGYAIPHYVIDAPGGGGKIPISPNYVMGQDNGSILLTNYAGNLYSYPENL